MTSSTAESDRGPATGFLDRPISRAKRRTTVACVLLGTCAFNLLLYVAGRAFGGTFAYTRQGKLIGVDAVAVTIMSVIPLAVGITIVGALSRRWPRLITVAKIVGPVLAVVTIGLMTVPAGFDTTSTLFLSMMHLVLAPAAVFALRALAPRP